MRTSTCITLVSLKTSGSEVHRIWNGKNHGHFLILHHFVFGKLWKMCLEISFKKVDATRIGGEKLLNMQKVWNAC